MGTFLEYLIERLTYYKNYMMEKEEHISKIEEELSNFEEEKTILEFELENKIQNLQEELEYKKHLFEAVRHKAILYDIEHGEDIDTIKWMYKIRIDSEHVDVKNALNK